MACIVLGYFVAFGNGSLVSTQHFTLAIYFAVQRLCVFKIGLFAVVLIVLFWRAHSIVWIVILTMNKMFRSSNLCRQGT